MTRLVNPAAYDFRAVRAYDGLITRSTSLE
jgi:hypothetical protein